MALLGEGGGVPASQAAARRRRLRLLAARARQKAIAEDRRHAAETRARAVGQGRREVREHGHETHRGGKGLARAQETYKQIRMSSVPGSKIVNNRVVRNTPLTHRSPIGLKSNMTKQQFMGFMLSGKPPEVIENLGQDVVDSVYGLGYTGAALGLDFRDVSSEGLRRLDEAMPRGPFEGAINLRRRDPTPGRTLELGKQAVEGYKYQYGPLVHGDVGEFGRRFSDHPLGPLLDAMSIATLGAGGAARAGLIRVPATRRLRYLGGEVQPHASRNTLVRALEHATDRVSERHPEVPVIGARARVRRRIPLEREREFDDLKAEVIPLERAAARLRPAERFAFDVHLRYGDLAPQRLRQEIEFRTARLEERTTLRERVAQRKTLMQLRAAEKHVLRPSERLAHAVEEGKILAGKTQDMKIELGLLNPENLAGPIERSSRAITSETVERPRTFDEARARADELDVELENMRKEVAATVDLSKFPRREGRRAMRQQADEERALAEDFLDALAAKEPKHEMSQKYLALRNEREALRSPLIQQQESAFGGVEFGAAPKQIDFGMHTERTAGEAPGAGAVFVPDVARATIKSIGRRKRGVTSKPQKIVYKSEGILFEQGRGRRGTKPTIEDFLKASRFKSHLLDQKDALTYSKPLNPKSPDGLNGPDWVFINPEGVQLPRYVRDEPANAELGDMTPREVAEYAHEEYQALLKNTFPDESNVRRLPPAMQKKVRQVPKDLAEAYQQGKVRMPGYGHGIGKFMGDSFEQATDLFRTGLLFGKGSYVPLNYASNLVFGAIHQGPFMLPNLLRSAQLIGDYSPANLRRMDTRVGEGGSLAMAGQGRGMVGRATQKLAKGSAILADRSPRRAAFIYEARRRGFKTDAQMTELFENPKHKRMLNQIGEDAEKGMVQFRGMSPFQQDWLTKIIFIYPWLRGATKYGGKLPLERPLQANLIAHLGPEGYDKMKEQLGQVVSYLEQVVPIGKPVQKLGTTIVPTINPQSVTPLGTGLDVLTTAKGFFEGQPKKRIFQFAHPTIKAAVEAGTGYNTFLGRAYPSDMSGFDIASESIKNFPAVRFVKGLSEEKQTKPYPKGEITPNYAEGGPKEAIGQMFLGGLWPRGLIRPAAQQRGLDERLERMTPVQRTSYKVNQKTSQWLKEAKRVKVWEQAPPKIRTAATVAVKSYKAREIAYAQEMEKQDVPSNRFHVRDRYKVDLRLAFQRKIIPRNVYNVELARVGKLNDTEVERYRGWLLDAMGEKVLVQLREAIREAGGTTAP